jgi:Regulator of ribonuclease activity B
MPVKDAKPARHNRVVNEMAIARRIDGTVCFQHMRDALDAATVLNDAGFDVEILWERIDDYSDAGFMKVERYAHCDTDAAADAFYDQVQALVDPFDGQLDDWGFSA